MILKCNCINSSADSLYGNGLRPHSALVKFAERPTPRTCVSPPNEEYACDYCSYARTKVKGMVSGVK